MGVVEPRPKRWQERRLVSERAFDKLRLIDCTFAEFAAACEEALIIEESDIAEGVKELLLTVAWIRPLHIVVIVGVVRAADRIMTIYEPEPAYWSVDFMRRR